MRLRDMYGVFAILNVFEQTIIEDGKINDILKRADINERYTNKQFSDRG